MHQAHGEGLRDKARTARAHHEDPARAPDRGDQPVDLVVLDPLRDLRDAAPHQAHPGLDSSRSHSADAWFP